MKFVKLCWVLLLFVSFFLNSCISQDREVQTFDVACETFCEEDYILGKPNQIAIFDSVLAIIDRSSDSLIHLFNVNEGSFSNKLGRTGQGPNEFTAISSLVSTERGFAMYDPNKRKYYDVHLKNELVVITPLYVINGLAPLDILPLSKNRYLSTGIYKTSKFCISDANGEIISFMGNWPYRDEKENKVSNHIKAQAYMSKIAVSPSKENVVSYSMTADLLSFYKVENDSLILLKESVRSFPEYDYMNNATSFRGTYRGAPIAYLAGSTTNKYVYVLYSGKSTQEYKEKAFLGNIIYVYSWDGEKIAEIRCDKSLSSFCIDGKRNVAYAIAYTPEPVLVKFFLPKI